MPSPQETQERQAITESLWAYTQDAEKAARIDHILARVKDTAFVSRIWNAILRDKISSGYCCQAINGHDFPTAIAWAKFIQNADQRTVILRKIAGYAAVEPANLDKAVEALNLIEKPNLQSEAVYSLSMARVILGDHASAQAISRTAKDAMMREMIMGVVDFAVQNKEESIDQIRRAAVQSDPGATRHRIALIFAARKDIKGIFQSLQGTADNLMANIISVFARALGWSGLYEEALALLNEITNPLKKCMQQGYLVTHVAFPPSLAEPIIVQLSEIEALSLTPSVFIFEKAFSNQMTDAVKILQKLTSQKTQSMILYQLVDDLYTISTID